MPSVNTKQHNVIPLKGTSLHGGLKSQPLLSPPNLERDEARLRFQAARFRAVILGTLSKRGRQRQCRESRNIFLSNSYILLSIYLLWLPCMFLFSVKLLWLQRLLLNETMDVSSENVGHDLKTAWTGAVEVSFESGTAQMSALFHIFTCAFCILWISLIVLPTLPSPSSAVLLKLPTLFN